MQWVHGAYIDIPATMHWPQLLWNITIFEGNWKYKQLFQFTSITIQVWENSSSTSSELIENFHFCQAWKVRHNLVLKFLVQFLGKPANQLLQTENFLSCIKKYPKRRERRVGVYEIWNLCHKIIILWHIFIKFGNFISPNFRFHNACSKCIYSSIKFQINQSIFNWLKFQIKIEYLQFVFVAQMIFTFPVTRSNS